MKTHLAHPLAFGISVASYTAPAAGAEPDQQRALSDSHFLQYGVSFVAENVAKAADVCPSSASAPPPGSTSASVISSETVSTPCVLGSGFGATIRVGYRSRGPWYFGGAYEFSHQDSANLLRLAILQQLRAEARFYFAQGTRLTPYGSGALGAVIYGNEWGAKSGGPSASLGLGAEYQADESVVVGLGLSWRTLVFRRWRDTDSQGAPFWRADRYLGFGLGHLIALELTLEVRDPLPRW